ncbi:DNA polymerase III subunit beta [Aurantimonas sp. DM33-3]|uniref:DNA polymerase III subunit beta n=1 Tax=Aurantimonas sp. DM33-3 TaxID=2766955 RepID=UPI0016521D5F|nr:DNA polymerase III subunit beta [Aurantimonas sp. DM33-3]MBC6714758.1 DNA polymerase III subunit beta [Aurantimonas sp. DM33-3]
MTNVTPIRANMHQAVATMARTHLKAGLDAAIKVIEKRNTIPILSNVKLSTYADQLIITATDLDIEIAVRVPCEALDRRFAATVPAHSLRDLVTKSKADTIELTAPLGGDEDAPLTITHGAASMKLPTLPVADYPEVEPGTFTHSFVMSAPALTGSFGMVSFAVSKEETRYYLNGIFMHRPVTGDGEGDLRFVATDGHRLAIKTVTAPAGTAAIPGVIIPRKTIEVVEKLMSRERGEVAIEVQTAKVRMTFGRITITSKVIDGTFPDYQRVIPSANDKAVTFNCDALTAAVDGVTVISTERGRAVKLTLSPGSCRLMVRSPDAGTAEADITCTTEVDEFEIGFNASYLKALAAVAGEIGEEFEMRFSDCGSPAVIRGASPTWSAVLMPMRV